jgi:cytochrome c556
MKAMSAAARDGAAIAKGDTPFEAAKAQAVFKVFADAGKKLPALFPENSREGGQTRAAPAIWDDAAGFKAVLAKFEANATAGAAVTDLAGFRAAFGTAGQDCSTCHETYRTRR